MGKFLIAMVLTGVLFTGGLQAEEKAEAVKDDAKVSVIGENKTFHNPECTFVKKAAEAKKEIKTLTAKEAKAAGLNACKVCLDKAEKKDGKAEAGKAEAKAVKKAEKAEEKAAAEK